MKKMPNVIGTLVVYRFATKQAACQFLNAGGPSGISQLNEGPGNFG